MKIKTPSAGETHLPIIGKKLFKLALSWSMSTGLPGTQKDRDEAIKSIKSRKALIHGSKAVKTAREAVEEAAGDIRRLRRERKSFRQDAGLRYCALAIRTRFDSSWRRRDAERQNQGEIRPSYLLPGRTIGDQREAIQRGLIPQKPLAERLESRIRKSVHQAYKASMLDLSVAGEETWSILTTTFPERVTAKAETYKDWNDRYSGRKSRYAKTAINVGITVPHRYLSRVVKRGLAVVDGMMTLDAQPMDCKEPGIEVFRARWVEQGVGKTLKTIDGFIARTTDRRMAFHGKTYGSALTGLRRKQHLAEQPESAADRAEKIIKAFVSRWKGKDFEVSVQDAKDTGSCDYGIRSWCHAHDLPYSEGKAHISAVIEAYRKSPLPEARRAILHAWSRHQHATSRAA